MQAHDRFWKLTALAAVAGLFYVGASLRSVAPAGRGLSLLPSAQAQVVAPAITTDGLDVIITQDPRGRKLYVWSFEKWDQDHVRLPVYLGAVEATE